MKVSYVLRNLLYRQVPRKVAGHKAQRNMCLGTRGYIVSFQALSYNKLKSNYKVSIIINPTHIGVQRTPETF